MTPRTGPLSVRWRARRSACVPLPAPEMPKKTTALGCSTCLGVLRLMRLVRTVRTPQPVDFEDARALLKERAAVTLYGAIFVKGVPRGSYPFSCLSVSLFDLGNPFLHPDPRSMRPAARRSGQGWRGSATEGSSLRAPSTTAHLARVGDDDIEGSSRGGARLFVPHPCMRRGTETQTMMQ